MKTNFKLLSLTLLIFLGLISCDESKTTYNSLSFPNDAFIAFSNPSVESLESTVDPITVTAYLANTSSVSSDTNVSFTIAGDAVEGVDYTIVGGKSAFSFPAGVYTDSIEVQLIDNTTEDGDKVITLTLSNSTVALGQPGPDSFGKSFDFTIVDDDCAFSLQQMGSASWSGADNVPASQAGPNDSQITTSFDGTNLLLEGIGYAWITDPAYWDEVVINSYPVIAQVDLISGAIIIAEQPLCDTTWLGNPQNPYSVVGTGQYVSCSQTMTIDYDIIQGGSVLRSFSETITIIN